MSVYNVKAFGAVGDCKFGLGGSLVNGSPTLTVPNAQFSPSDVGKLIYCVAQEDVQVMAVTTIKTFNSATSVDLNANAGYTATNVVQYAYTTQDDTAAFVAAFNAAVTADFIVSADAPSSSGTVYAPSGGYWLSSRIYAGAGQVHLPHLIADPQMTQFFLPPNFTIPGDGSPAFIDCNNAYGVIHRGWSIIGPSFNFAMGGNQALCSYSQVSKLTGEDINSIFVSGNNGGAAGPKVFLFDSCNQLYLKHVVAQNASNGSLVQGQTNRLLAAQFNACAGTILECLLSNYYGNILVTGNATGDADGSQGLLNAVDLFVDEGGPIAAQILTGGRLHARGGTFFSTDAAGDYAIAVDGTSKLWLDDCLISPYLPSGGAGALSVRIDAGGEVRAARAKFRSSNAPSKIAITNNGKFFMGEGCEFEVNSGLAYIPTYWRDAISNPNNIWRTL